jgi:succinylarginine dihydrolase
MQRFTLAVPEICFDGLVGPTHSYAGLSPGNLAAMRHAGQIGNPKSAALQGIQKMRFVASLGVLQGVLPPQPRPDLGALRQLGFSGTDADVLASVQGSAPEVLRAVSSASAMWTANAATVTPSLDSQDARVHLVVANLSSMFHRSLEAPTTLAILRRIFDSDRFCVHDPLPAQLADEGAANHLRLSGPGGGLHLYAWGRRIFGAPEATRAGPREHPARQTLEASAAVARLSGLSGGRALLWQQHPDGIDAGAFHSDVLAVGNENFLMLHELAFVEPQRLIAELRRRLGGALELCLATERELAVRDAVATYPFNSELVTIAPGKMAIIAPTESREHPSARRFLERVVAEQNPVQAVHYIDVNASMKNGGGPACLRLRVLLSDEERALLRGRVIGDDSLFDELEGWVERRYRDRLSDGDLSDPVLLEETRAALDELTRILELGPIYDFQR